MSILMSSKFLLFAVALFLTFCEFPSLQLTDTALETEMKTVDVSGKSFRMSREKVSVLFADVELAGTLDHHTVKDFKAAARAATGCQARTVPGVLPLLDDYETWDISIAQKSKETDGKYGGYRVRLT